MTTLEPSFDELRARVDAVLRAHLAERRGALPESSSLIDELVHVVDAGGKRLRPTFCYWGHRAAGGVDGDEITRSSAALELLHTFALVHDDIMDGASSRRGVDTIHVRRDTNIAILAGDLALVLADHLLTSAGWDADTVVLALEPYGRMREEVIAGQYLDLVNQRDPLVTEQQARAVAQLKSGRYTVVQPLRIGAVLAGADDTMLEGLERYGSPIGEAFQLRDDLLGTFGEEGVLGKPVDSDIREGKRTLLYAKALELLDEPERDELLELWGSGDAIGPAEVARARELLEECGARAAMEELLEALVTEGLRALDELALDPAPRLALEELARITVHREH